MNQSNGANIPVSSREDIRLFSADKALPRKTFSSKKRSHGLKDSLEHTATKRSSSILDQLLSSSSLSSLASSSSETWESSTETITTSRHNWALLPEEEGEPAETFRLQDEGSRWRDTRIELDLSPLPRQRRTLYPSLERQSKKLKISHTNFATGLLLDP